MFDKMRQAVLQYVKEHLEVTDNTKVELKDIYIVWSCKTLQNWKALISTTLPDGMYYECTYNGDKAELYIDAYKKWDNKVIREYNRIIDNEGKTIVDVVVKTD